MEHLNLAGDWELSQDGGKPIPGHLPGSAYLDYISNGMPDPFWGMNELEAKKLAEHDYTYAREFDLPEEFLSVGHVDLLAWGLDTLCALVLNGKELAKTNNINRTWRFDAKPFLRPGKNSIAIQIEAPFDYLAKLHKKEPMGGMSMGTKSIAHLRKTPCHFGWDWGPSLPPAGLIGGIELQAYETRIEDLRIKQKHSDGKVSLEISAEASSIEGVSAVLSLTDPEGGISSCEMRREGGKLRCTIDIKNPQLWWCNGLGGQPLYTLELLLKQNGKTADSQSRKIGLRTVELDTSPDRHGNQFRFVINGVPIFAKGADWIPADSFITRFTREDADFYIKSAKRANMNMLRVWGGGMYESEDFYDACDRNGILVWQDFIFACSPYPFYKQEFLNNVRAEVIDNVRRLRHRASLAVWSGNNECEVFRYFWKKGSPIEKSNMPFYHNTLREWVEELDGATPYWPGSPSSGSLEHRVHSLKEGSIRGDTHLWQIWHGMMPIEAFRGYPTRFCSEFGMESMPSMHTVRTYTDAPDPSLFDPIMQLHQKSGGGNEKMLFYLLAKYRNPAKFEDFVYLSQLVQANTVRFATDCWRRNIGRQNGAIFWQYNDCWPVASWAGIDYGKQLKAVTYQARHFNKMLCLSNDYFDDRAEIYIVNEYPGKFAGTLEWELRDFGGRLINRGSKPVSVGGVSSVRAEVLKFDEIRGKLRKEESALLVRLLQEGEVKDEKYWLLVPDKNAALPKADVKADFAEKDGLAAVTLNSKNYARYVYLEAKGVTAPWSDNFFDIPAGRSVSVTVKLPEGMSLEQLQKNLKIKTLADVEPKNSLAKDKLLRFEMVLRKKNYLTWLAFKFI
ncbi:MAG: hypothetical protein LBC56_01785 [Oscillospiraceae bacterium]|nr:hypothetical protein [Oscillospiraceae bacterium]